MRIGFLIDRWQPTRGGAERALAQLARHLESQGHEVHAFGEEGPREGEDAPGEFHAVSCRGVLRGARERNLAELMLAAASGAGCDVTVGVRHLPRVDVLWPHGGTHAGTLHALRKRAWGRHNTFLQLEREAFTGGARRIMCVSQQVEREALDYYPASASRLVLVPNGVDLERFHPREREPARRVLSAELGLDAADDTPVLSFVGHNAKLKGLPRLLAALKRMRQDRWRLIVAGPKDPELWQRRARRAGFDEQRIVVRPYLDGQVLAAGADLCVLPSQREPCGLVVLEALACGTPVLVSDAVGARMGLDEVAGRVVKARGGARELTAALQAALASQHADGVDRDAVRATVKDRGLDTWLARMEQVVVAASAKPTLG